jgi:Family of unknown function (DUF6527)
MSNRVNSRKLRKVTGGHVHWCPACQDNHVIPDTWDFNQSYEAPTFGPSVRITGVQKNTLPDGEWFWPKGDDGKPLARCCHYFVKDGNVEYCSDSLHGLAGLTIPLPEIPAALFSIDDSYKYD